MFLVPDDSVHVFDMKWETINSSDLRKMCTWVLGGRATFIAKFFKNLWLLENALDKIIKLNLFTWTIESIRQIQEERIPKCDCPHSGKGCHGFDGCFDEFSVVEVVQLLFCCASKQTRAKAACRGFSWGCWTTTRPLVRLSVSSVGWKGSCCAHDSRMWNWKPRYTPIISPTTLVHPLEYIWLFGVYGGTSSCSLRNDQEYPLPVLPFLSAHFVSRVPTPLRSEDSRYGVWGMDREWRYTFYDSDFVKENLWKIARSWVCNVYGLGR